MGKPTKTTLPTLPKMGMDWENQPISDFWIVWNYSYFNRKMGLYFMVILIGTLMEYTKRSGGVPYLGTPPVCLYMYMVCATILERKLRSMKVRLFTVPCCSIIPVSSEPWKKNTLNLLLTFFVFLKFLLNCVFPHISHIYQCSIIACSIINFAIILFYNSGFYVHSFGVPERCIKWCKYM